MDRKEVIMWLNIIRTNLNNFPEVSSAKKIEALTFAIDSLEVDETYDLEYEKTRNGLGGRQWNT